MICSAVSFAWPLDSIAWPLDSIAWPLDSIAWPLDSIAWPMPRDAAITIKSYQSTLCRVWLSEQHCMVTMGPAANSAAISKLSQPIVATATIPTKMTSATHQRSCRTGCEFSKPLTR